ncbi:MAG: CRISPR-associated helicase Cas3' [Clostridium sp.]|nr:CRISPR-associated helicase Cas3' [Clostridium sp.]
MDIKNYMAKNNPKKTLEEHTNDLLSSLEIMNDLGYIRNKDIYKLAKKACYYHDFGKVNDEFQKRVKSEKKLKFNKEKEIFHNILSLYFINSEDFEDEEDYYRICHAVLNHHNYCEDPILYIRENKQLIQSTLEKFPTFKVKQSQLNKISRKKDDEKAILIKGYLHKCDYSASASYVVEYKNDFLKTAMNNLLCSWKKNNSEAKWNKLQEFCLENQNNNIIAVAQTGMGKTEGGLLWFGNSKGYFVLPIRTAINAIYDRVRKNILNNENIAERVSILHSSALEYYNKNIDDQNLDIFEYNKRGKQLSMPLTISTMDQLFDFVLKYQGYELKLTTFSYSKIVIDEIQMYGPDLLAYLIYGIKTINKFGGKIAILTATLAPFIKDMLTEISFKYGKFTNDVVRHNIEVKNEFINAKDIINKYEDNKKNKKGNKILVICNTIKKAQELYDEIYLDLSEEDRENLNILHSRFIKKDRSEKELKILACGQTYNKDKEIDIQNSIWISTSIVEASLDIDFDYIFTELQELNSLFQRLGRCNRKGVKKVEEPNSFIYTQIEGIKLGNTGFIDETLFNLSKKALENVSGKITEEKKIELIEEWLTTDNLKDSDYMREYREIFDFIENIPPYSIEKNKIKLRNILSVDVIPLPVYEENKKVIEEANKKLEEDNLTSEERIKLTEIIKDYVVSIPLYQKCEKVREIKLNRSESIPIVKCIYDKKGITFSKKDDKKVEFL